MALPHPDDEAVVVAEVLGEERDLPAGVEGLRATGWLACVPDALVRSPIGYPRSESAIGCEGLRTIHYNATAHPYGSTLPGIAWIASHRTKTSYQRPSARVSDRTDS